ncbi:MAG TPA: VOC family protein [Terracidiphilus sp.]|nr:VOC family protein [Terracidiphilus sp.]
MPARIVPMIHVSNVAATADWYASIGFEIRGTNRECEHGEIDWALLRLGESEIMLSAGGRTSSDPRREFDLYTHVDDVDALRSRLDGKAEIVEDLHDTFSGMREFIIRDCNGFWITFGQPISQ